MTIFGRIITDAQIEDAVTAALQEWLPTYLSETERQAGLVAGFYARPRSFSTRTDFDKFMEEQLPAIIVVSGGVTDSPLADGHGAHRAGWDVGVVAITSARDQLTTRRMNHLYSAAIRAILLQKQDLGGSLDGVRGVTWEGSRNDQFAVEDDRTLWASRQLFTVEVGDVVSKFRGPVVPDPKPDPEEPYGDWPQVDTVQNTITKEPIT